MTTHNTCKVCGHKAVIRSIDHTKASSMSTSDVHYYCANCYTKVINSFTHRPKYNGRKKELCLKPITPR